MKELKKRLSFGKYPSVSLQQVRKLRDDEKAVLALGDHPGVLKQEAKIAKREAHGHTLEKFGRPFLEKLRKEDKPKATLAKTGYHLKLANDGNLFSFLGGFGTMDR